MVADEGESGILDRPGMQTVLERIARHEVDGLVAAKLDRISRSVRDFADLLEWFGATGASLVAVDVGVDTSTPGGKLVCGVFSAVSEWERDVIASRTRDGLAALRAQGRPISRAAVADNPKLAKRIRKMREAGQAYQAIADALNKDKVPTLRGHPVDGVRSQGSGGVRAAEKKRAAMLPSVGRPRRRRTA